MSRNQLLQLNIHQLKKICESVKIPCEKKSKSQIIDILDSTFNKKQVTKQTTANPFKKEEKSIVSKPPYKIINSIGIEGRDGKVSLVSFKGKKYALKQFRTSKPSEEIKKEINFLEKASKEGISPKIIHYDLKEKYIIMDLLENSLFDVLRMTNGIMSVFQQREFVKLNEKMDQIGIYHGDPSPLNFLFDKKNKLKVIDFGFSEYIDKKFIQKHNSKTPNQKFMLLGFILKMKSLGVDVDNNYNYIKRYIDKSDLEKCGIKIKEEN